MSGFAISSARNAAPEAEMSGLPRGEHGYRRIRSVLQAGDFKPGELLREIELAESVGVTRDASGGNMVAELDYSMVTELHYINRARK